MFATALASVGLALGKAASRAGAAVTAAAGQVVVDPVVVDQVVVDPVVEPVVVEQTVVHTGLDLFLPTWPDILWSSVVLLIIAFAFYKFFMPKFMGILDQRSEMIAGGLEQAEQVKVAAEETLAQRQAMLEEARGEASEIREKAHNDYDQIVEDAKHAADKEAKRIEEDSKRRVEAQKIEAEVELRTEVGTLATDLAAKIIGASLSTEAAQSQAIDRYLDELEAETQAAKKRGLHAKKAGVPEKRSLGRQRKPAVTEEGALDLESGVTGELDSADELPVDAGDAANLGIRDTVGEPAPAIVVVGDQDDAGLAAAADALAATEQAAASGQLAQTVSKDSHHLRRRRREPKQR